MNAEPTAAAIFCPSANASPASSMRYFRRSGRLSRDEDEGSTQYPPDEPLFAERCAASVQGAWLSGPITARAPYALAVGRRIPTRSSLPESSAATSMASRSTPRSGSSRTIARILGLTPGDVSELCDTGALKSSYYGPALLVGSSSVQAYADSLLEQP